MENRLEDLDQLDEGVASRSYKDHSSLKRRVAAGIAVGVPILAYGSFYLGFEYGPQISKFIDNMLQIN